VLAVAAADGLARVRARGPQLRVLGLAAPAMAVIALASVAAFPLGRLFENDAWHVPAEYAGAERLVALIPGDAAVTASNRFVPHLAHRDVVELPDPGHPSNDWVLLATADDSPEGLFPLPDEQARAQLLTELAVDYREVGRAPGAVLLTRPPPGAP
jgi:hypothetical protein